MPIVFYLVVLQLVILNILSNKSKLFYTNDNGDNIKNNKYNLYNKYNTQRA